MTARTDLTRAAALSARLDQVTAAILRLNAGEQPAGIIFRPPDGSPLVVDVPLPINAVTNLLTALQTALQNQLTALGVI
jgi:hypothetical protein